MLEISEIIAQAQQKGASVIQNVRLLRVICRKDGNELYLTQKDNRR